MRLWLCLLRVLSSVRGWCIACLLAGGVLALHSRHEMNPDGLSYLDIATEALRHGPAELVNPYWSPGYPGMIAIALRVANPLPAQEVPLIHVVNFLIFVVTLVAFCYFLRSWLAALKEYAPVTPSDRSLLTGFVFALFFYFIVKDIGLHLVTPDLALAAVLFAAAGLGCRLCVPATRVIHHVALGVVLGAGYYLKSAMFPLAPAFLALVYLAGPRATRMRRYGVLLSGVAFLVTVSPLVTVLSLRMNKFTYGEVGRLNYAWFVNGLVWTARNEVPEALGTRDFSAPKLFERPLTFVFSGPVKGTYPVWYDPAYWYADAKPTFNLRQQLVRLRETWQVYKGMMFETMPLLTGALVLCTFAVSSRRRMLGGSLPLLRFLAWQAGWAMAALAMYALVWVEPRYTAVFLVLVWAAIYAVLTRNAGLRVKCALCSMAVLTLILPYALVLASRTVTTARSLAVRIPPGYESAALGLRAAGLREGDHLAVVGYGHDCYYARAARMRVMAQIPYANEFWELSASETQAVRDRLASVGVKAIVARNRPDQAARAGWIDIQTASERFSVLLTGPATAGPVDR